MLWTGEGKIFCVNIHLETKIIPNCLKIDATHHYDNDLLLKQETKKGLYVLKADIITI